MYGLIRAADEMTSRQRLLAAYHGEQIDRLPYWVKLSGLTWQGREPDGAKNWSYPQKLDYIHADGLFGVGHGVQVDRPHVQTEPARSDRRRVNVTHTPDGDLVEEWGLDPDTHAEHPIVFPVKTVEDVHRWRWVYTDVAVTLDDDGVRKANEAAENK